MSGSTTSVGGVETEPKNSNLDNVRKVEVDMLASRQNTHHPLHITDEIDALMLSFPSVLSLPLSRDRG